LEEIRLIFFLVSFLVCDILLQLLEKGLFYPIFFEPF